MMSTFAGKNWVFTFFPLGPIQANVTIVLDKVRDVIAVFDAGHSDIRTILQKAKELSPTAKITEAVFTHGHLDHIMGATALKQATNCRLSLSKDDEPLWNALPMQCSMFGMRCDEKPVKPDAYINDGDVLDIGCKAIHVPGHSPGSMAFLFSGGNAGKDLLIAGDTLFNGGIGRTDFMGGDSDKIEHSITQVLYKLSPDTEVICGHGETTTIGREKRYGVFTENSSF